MFCPTKIWRRWHRKVNVNQRRFAIASALAATALPALVMARGHRIDEVAEFPLVVDDSLTNLKKTKEGVAFLQRFGAYPDVEKSRDSRKVRCGAGKARNRRFTQRRGPLIIYEQSNGLDRAFRNIPGVQTATVDNLNLLDLAPGGHLGRFVIWTKSAFEKLDKLFGTYEKPSELKKGFLLPGRMMTNADLARIINSDEVQSALRPAVSTPLILPKKRNAVVKKAVRVALNPYYATVQKREAEKRNLGDAAKANVLAAKRAEQKARNLLRPRRKAFYRAAVKEGDVTF